MLETTYFANLCISFILVSNVFMIQIIKKFNHFTQRLEIIEKDCAISSNHVVFTGRKKDARLSYELPHAEEIKEKEARLTKATEGSCHQHGQQCNYQHQYNLYEYFPLKFSHV